MGARGCPSQAGVKGVGTALMSSTSSKAPRTSIVNSSPESTVIVGGVWVLTEKRYSVRLALMCRSPFVADTRAGQQHNRRIGAIWSFALPERRLARIGVSYSLFEVGDLGQGRSGGQCCSRGSTT